MDKKISIIIPVYKVEEYLDKCVESVVRQTYENLEIILVDDGSPDNCPKMCDEWATKDTRIRVIHKENGGLSDARNTALDTINGQYIMFVDSDDYIECTMCERLVNLLEKNNCDFVMSGLNVFHENVGPIKNDEEIETFLFKGDELIDLLFNDKIRFFSIACAKLYKKEMFENLRYERGRLHEDEFAITKILLSANKFGYTNEQLYYYLQREGSITKAKTEKNIKDAFDAFTIRYELFTKQFPERVNQLKLSYMANLRGLYVLSCALCQKNLRRMLKRQFNLIYANAKTKAVKDILFKYFTGLYVLYSRAKNKDL